MKKFMHVGLLLAVLMGSGCGEKAAHDLPPIQEEGVLRVLRPATAMAGLPRGESPEAREAALVRNYAKDHDLALEWVEVAPDRLVDELLAGRGDMAIGYRMEEEDAGANALFSRPVFNPLKPDPAAKGMGMEKTIPKPHGLSPDPRGNCSKASMPSSSRSTPAHGRNPGTAIWRR